MNALAFALGGSVDAAPTGQPTQQQQRDVGAAGSQAGVQGGYQPRQFTPMGSFLSDAVQDTQRQASDILADIHLTPKQIYPLWVDVSL